MNFGRVSAEIWVCLFMLENTTTIENKKEISIALISSLPPVCDAQLPLCQQTCVIYLLMSSLLDLASVTLRSES